MAPRAGQEGALLKRESPSRSLDGLPRLREGLVCAEDPAATEGMGRAGKAEDGVTRELNTVGLVRPEPRR